MSDTTQPLIAYVGLGSNIGDREAYLRESIRAINETSGLRVVRQSGIYETDPVGYLDQPAFLNMAVAVETVLSPHELLDVLLEIERKLGRIRDILWGPRTIDLDLLLYEDVRMNTPELILPHPRMLERAFVLVPLLDLTKAGEIPGIEKSVLRHPEGKEGVKRWTNTH